jgi:hypothetical protein
MSLSLADQIRSAVTAPNGGYLLRPWEIDTDFPLPLASNWAVGINTNGFTSAYQRSLFDAGRHFLPWFGMPTPDADNVFPRPDDILFLKFCRDNNLPISLNHGGQWQYMLYKNGSPYRDLTKWPMYNNPCQVYEASPGVFATYGKLSPLAAEFDAKSTPLGGDLTPFRDCGKKWASSVGFAAFRSIYPNPPKVLMLSNNEGVEIDPNNDAPNKTLELNDVRWATKWGTSKDLQFKLDRMDALWTKCYTDNLFAAWRDNMSEPDWKAGSFVRYHKAGFGPWLVGRSGSPVPVFARSGLSTTPNYWDGVCNSFYLWKNFGDDTIDAPQVGLMSQLFARDDNLRMKPQFWGELLVSEEVGSTPDQSDVVSWTTPHRYLGCIQYALWLLRPRVLREYRGSQTSVAQNGDYFTAVLDAIDHVWSNPTLETFWKRGRLVANDAYWQDGKGYDPTKFDFGTPYAKPTLPEEFRGKKRWFRLDVTGPVEYNDDLNRSKWSIKATASPCRIWPMALEMGIAPNREWLVYVYSPQGDVANVKIVIPGFREVSGVTARKEGSWWRFSEAKTDGTPSAPEIWFGKPKYQD